MAAVTLAHPGDGLRRPHATFGSLCDPGEPPTDSVPRAGAVPLERGQVLGSGVALIGLPGIVGMSLAKGDHVGVTGDLRDDACRRHGRTPGIGLHPGDDS